MICGAAPSIAYNCTYIRDKFVGYSCEFQEISYLEENAEFEIIGKHINSMMFDTDVLGIFSTLSNISYIPQELFMKFENIVHIQMNESNLESIDGAFKLCNNVATMKFRNNNLKRLPSRNLENCWNLQSFDVTGNQIDFLPSGAFDGATKLVNLTLYNNPIKVIEPGVFDELTNLELLFMLGTEVTELHPELLLNQKKLIQFEYGSDVPFKFVKIKTRTFKSLPALTFMTIKFKGVERMEIEAAAFEDLENLEGIDLYENSIQRLNTNSFVNLPRMTFLAISDNEIVEIERTFFSNFPSLMGVYAWNNDCVDKAFYGVDDLFYLGMEKCFANYDESLKIVTEEETTPTTAASTGSLETTGKVADTTLGSFSIIPSFLNVLGAFAVFLMVYIKLFV